ncbi:MAG: hypothetical protein ACI9HH_005706, partial [Pseudomonadota bacterium]
MGRFLFFVMRDIPRPTRDVVLAKARTHYPRSLLFRRSGATAFVAMTFGGYGS